MFKILFALFFISLNCNASNEYIRKYVFEWLYNDKNVALNYLEKSVNIEKPSADAAFILGSLYLDEITVKKNLEKADYYITLAANLNHSGAINSIGDGYYTGDIREKDIQKALVYYEKSAKLGYGPAQFNAGVVCLKLATCKKDLKKAIFWLDKASKNYDDLGDMTKDVLKYKKDAENKLRDIYKSKK